jgi:hypothetical protein
MDHKLTIAYCVAQKCSGFLQDRKRQVGTEILFILHNSSLHPPLFTRRVSVMTGFGAAGASGEDRLARGGSLKNAPRRVLGARLHRPRPLCKELRVESSESSKRCTS